MSATIETAAQAATDNPDAVTAAVAAQNAAPAPADSENQRMAAIERQQTAFQKAVEDMMAFITKYDPALEAGETVVAAEVPSLDPVINRISQFETWAEQLLVHFQHKIPALPPAA